MKSMQKFAAQQLSKSQMNNIKGGWACFVVTGHDENGDNVGYWKEVPADDQYAAADYVAANRPAGAIQVNC